MKRTSLPSPYILGPTALLVLEVIMLAASPPTVREIATRVGCQVGTVQRHMDRLLSKGLIRFEMGRARTVRSRCFWLAEGDL